MLSVEDLAHVDRFDSSIREPADLRETELIRSHNFGNNAFQLRGGLNGLITVHASNGPKAFWGVSDNVLSRFKKDGASWCVILLHDRNDNGYVISPSAANRAIKDGIWSQQEKSGIHHKVYLPEGIRGSFRFRSLDELLGILRVLLVASEPKN